MNKDTSGKEFLQSSPARRAALKQALALGGLAAVGPSALIAHASAKRDSASASASIRARDDSPVVELQEGKVVGYVHNGINTFKGMPYAKSTAGANRFVPPVKVDSWSGVRSARQYGQVAPQSARTGWANDEEAFMFSWDDGVQGEDCLRVNVWTPSINDHQKRPVMVWLHGGGFSAGSGQELKSYDGESLAPPQCARLSESGCLRRTLRGIGQRRHAGYHYGARVGARQHRRLRR
jgi:para-nitrobenzyl esterase